MSDTVTGEAPEAAPPKPPAPPAEPEGEPEREDNRTARQRVLDHLTDSEGPQTVTEIIQGTGLSRNTCEQAIFRAVQSEQIERVSQGVYRLAPPKPLPPSRNGHSNEEWVARIEAWQANPASWNVEEDGPPPNDPNHRIPLDVVGRLKDRQKRQREKAAKQAAADAALLDQLIAATGGNIMPGPGINDLAPIKSMLQDVPFDRVLIGLKRTVDRRIDPHAAPIASWRDDRFLRAVARSALLDGLLPKLLETWKAAGTAPQNPVDASKVAPAVQVPSEPADAPAASPGAPIDDLGELHQTAAGLMREVGGLVDVPGLLAQVVEGHGGIEKPPETMAAAPAVADDRNPVADDREQILAAFARNRTPPQPAKPPAPQPRPAVRQAGPAEPEFSDAAWDEFCAGFRFGTLKWNTRRLGPGPFQPGCRAPKHILKRNGLT